MGSQRVRHDWVTKHKHMDLTYSEWLVFWSPGQISSVQFSRSVVSYSLRPHESQQARLPCPSPTPRVYPNPCLLSWWCHPTISSSVVPFSSCPKSFPASGSFQMSHKKKTKPGLEIKQIGGCQRQGVGSGKKMGEVGQRAKTSSY